jgi:ketosteroid isomerase-like protein
MRRSPQQAVAYDHEYERGGALTRANVKAILRLEPCFLTFLYRRLTVRRIHIIFVLFCASASLVLARPASPGPIQASKAEQELLQIEREWQDALVKRDVATIERIEADDYMFTDPEGGVQDKATDIAQIKTGQLVFDSFKNDDMKVRVYGDAAVVTARSIVKGKFQDEDISGEYRSTDVFVKQQGRWRCVNGHVTRVANR